MDKSLLPMFISDAFGLVFIVVWIVGYTRQGVKPEENLRRLAEQLGLEFVARPRSVTGILRGKTVEVFTEISGWGGPGRQTSEPTISARPTQDTGLTFQLVTRTSFSKIGEEIGGWHSLATCDAVFDAAWFVQSNRPEYFVVALLPELRGKLLAVHAAGLKGRFELAEFLVKYIPLDDSFSDANFCARIPAILDILCDLAEIAEVAPSGGAPGLAGGAS